MTPEEGVIPGTTIALLVLYMILHFLQLMLNLSISKSYIILAVY